MRIITVNIQKGGSAKTTTVQASAEILSKKYNKRILCIDTDPQCNLTSASGIDPADCEIDLSDVLKGEANINHAIIHSKYYDIIPSSILLASADSMFTSIGKEHLLKEKLHELQETYDYILIDTAPALSLLNVMALTAATDVIVPLEPSRFAMQGMNQLNESIKLTRSYFNQNLNILGLLLIKYKGHTNLNRTVLDNIPHVAAQMETKVFNTQIRESIRIGECQLLGTPITDEKSNATEDYENFVKELMEEL